MQRLKTLGHLLRVLSLKETFKFIRVYRGIVKRDVIRMKNGLRFVVRGDSQGENQAFIDIFVHEAYAPKDFRLHDENVIIDIGAHVGLFSMYASLHAKNAKIICFEPVKENYSLILKNLKMNRLKDIIPVEAAVSGSSGKAKIIIHPSQSSAHSMYKEAAFPKGKAVTIRTISLADVCTNYALDTIDFLKIDCQGAEYDIFWNASDEVMARIKKIAMEYHDLDKKRNGKAMQRFLKSKGFMVRIPEEGMLFAWRK